MDDNRKESHGIPGRPSLRGGLFGHSRVRDSRDDEMNLVTIGQIAAELGLTRDAVVKWRIRYDDFPEKKAGNDHYPFYNLTEVRRWYMNRWPHRTERWQVRLHRYRIKAHQVSLESISMGSFAESRGYLQAVRDTMFDGWRVFYTQDGFSAHRGNESEIWVLDPGDSEPEPWYIYDSRFKAAGRTK